MTLRITERLTFLEAYNAIMLGIPVAPERPPKMPRGAIRYYRPSTSQEEEE